MQLNEITQNSEALNDPSVTFPAYRCFANGVPIDSELINETKFARLKLRTISQAYPSGARSFVGPFDRSLHFVDNTVIYLFLETVRNLQTTNTITSLEQLSVCPLPRWQ